MGIRLNYFDNDFTRGIRDATRNTNSFREGMGAATRSATGLASAVGVAAVALGGMVAAKKGFDWLVGANADMEQYQNTLTVVMGSVEEATKTLAWANKFASQTPFEIPQVVEATTKMQAYGISAKQTLGIVGDMASVMGKDLLQATEAISDAQTGEIERLKEFGITKSMIQDQAKLLGSNPIDSKGSITDMQGFNTALFSLMEKRFQGGMAMQSKSFKGMISNAQDFMSTMGRKLGKPLFDRGKKNLEGFLATLNHLQDSGAIDGFISQVHQAGAIVGRTFQSAYQVTVSTFRSIWHVVSPIINGIRSNWAKWQPVIKTLGYSLGVFAVALGGIKTALLGANIAMKLLNLTMLTNPIGWVALGMGLLVGWFIKMNGGIEGSKKKLLEYWAVVKGFGLQLWDTYGGKLTAIGQKAGQVFTWIFQKAKQAVSYVVQNWPLIKDAIVGQFMKVWGIVGPVLNQIVGNIVNGFMQVYNFFQQYWPGIQRFFILFWAGISPFVMAALKILYSIVFNAFRLIWATISNVWDMITGVIQVAWGIISGVLGVGMALLVGDWGGAWDAMLGMLTNVWDGLGKFFSGLGGLFYDSGKAIISTLVDGISAMAMAPVNAIKNVMGKVREFLPFSDAKKGPLSELTYSGGAIMTTLSTGVHKQQGALHTAVSNAFTGIGIPSIAAASMAVTPTFNAAGLDMKATANVTGQQMAPTTSFSAVGTNIAPTQVNAVAAPPSKAGTVAPNIIFGDIHIQTADGTDTVSLAHEVINQLYRKAKEATAILSSGDKAALFN